MTNVYIAYSKFTSFVRTRNGSRLVRVCDIIKILHYCVYIFPCNNKDGGVFFKCPREEII